MFETDEYISYGRNGVCKVEGITWMGMPGSTEKKKYYILKPVYEHNGTIYCPVDSGKGLERRKILSEKEAYSLLETTKDLEAIEATNRKAFDEKCKEALESGNCESWARLLKTLHVEELDRKRQGKKMTATNERYLKAAGEKLCGELAIAMHKEKAQVETILRSIIEVE